MKKTLFILVVLFLLTGCKNSKFSLENNNLYFESNEYECKYETLYEDDNLIVRSFCTPEIYLMDKDEKKMFLKETLNNKIIDVYDIMDGMEIIGEHENGDIDLKDFDNKYHIFNCSKRNISYRETETRINIIVTRMEYDEMICDF